MKKTISFILINLFFISCYTQNVLQNIDNTQISILNTVKIDSECNNEITIYTNQNDFDHFQHSIPKTTQRSGPIFQIDFEQKNIAILCKKDIYSYTIDSISVFKNKNILNISPIKNHNKRSNENILILEIPKKINTLTLNIN